VSDKPSLSFAAIDQSISEQQNVAIKNGTINGVEIRMVALGINNGWVSAALNTRSLTPLTRPPPMTRKFESIAQFKALIDYAYKNPYRSLINKATANSLTGIFNTTCKPALEQCSQTSSDYVCMNADSECYTDILETIAYSSDFNVYDLRNGWDDTFPLETYQTYLEDPSIMKAIGANIDYLECSDVVYSDFYTTGDRMSIQLIREVTSP